LNPTNIYWDSLRNYQNLKRQCLGCFTLLKYHSKTGSTLLSWIDWIWSARYDLANTNRYFIYVTEAVTGKDTYKAPSYKIGLEFSGKKARRIRYH